MTNPLHSLPLVALGPEVGTARAATVLVHGRGRTPAEMLGLAPRLALPEMSFLAPTAAGGTWYPQSFLAPVAENEPHLGWAIERVEAVVRSIEERGVPRERIAMVGFSQGACVVAEVAYRNPARWGALAILTGAVIGPAEIPRDGSGDLRGTPVFLGCSDVDAWVPLARVQATADLFSRMRASVELRVAPGLDHVVSDDQLASTRKLLEPLLVNGDGGSKST